MREHDAPDADCAEGGCDDALAALLEAMACALRGGDFEPVPATALPGSMAALLAHRGHMTAVIEAHYGAGVAVQVLQRCRKAQSYAREILLTLPGGRVVQYAVVDIALQRCPPAVRDEILAERRPLGRILQAIAADLRVEAVGFVRARLPAALATLFGVSPGTVAWGRLVRIHVGAECLIEGLEVLAPP